LTSTGLAAELFWLFSCVFCWQADKERIKAVRDRIAGNLMSILIM
jgi:hypothetical protein